MRALFVSLIASCLAACGGSGGSPQPQGGIPAVSETRMVTTLADDGPGSLRQAVADALPAARILFDPAIAGGVVLLQSPIEIDKSLFLHGGPHGSETVLDGDQNAGHFVILGAPYVHIRDIRLVNGNPTGIGGGSGGSIRAESTHLQLTRVMFLDCHAGYGGAVYIEDSELEVDACLFEANTAQQGGAVYLLRCQSTIRKSSFGMNTAYLGGGGAVRVAAGECNLLSCTLYDNESINGVLFGSGGAIAAYAIPFSDPAHLGLYGCTITGNHADGDGGGVDLHAFGSSVTCICRQTIIAENTAPEGPDVCVGDLSTLTGAYNLIGIADMSPIVDGVDGNIAGTAAAPVGPLLGPPQLGGFETFARAPLLGSPVRNVVPHDQSIDEQGAPLDLDQRFADRLGDGAADIGAIEFNP